MGVLVRACGRIVGVLAALAALAAAVALAPAPALAQHRIVLFGRERCPHCEHASEWLDELARRRSDVVVVHRDVIRDRVALDELTRLAAEQGTEPLAVPAILVRGRLFVGFASAETTGRALERWLDAGTETGAADPVCSIDPDAPCDDQLGGPAPDGARDGTSGEAIDDVISVPLLGAISVRSVGLPLFTIAIGLIDGFNPCAMWVLLFLLSMLVHLQDRARMALIAGTFVVVSALVYYAFMAAWLETHLLLGISRTLQVVLGVFALVVAAIHLKDSIAPGRGLSLSIPASAKPAIYARVRAIVRAENLPAAMAMVVTLAIAVNVVELLCTAGLPALYTHVLAAHGIGRAGRYAYLVLYDLAYMADDAVMVTIGVATLGRRKLQERGGRALKLLSGAVLGVLGLVLIFAPQWLLWG